MKRLVWLRHETKPFEERTALTPAAASKLLELGHHVVVEESPNRIFAEEEYQAAGCEIVPQNSWKTQAPREAVILGLKELEDEDTPLIHRHIFFAHAYKGQEGAEKTLSRFSRGGGLLYDLEFLTDKTGKRVAAFGIWAGFTGAALGVKLWAFQKLDKNLNQHAPLPPYKDEKSLIESIKQDLDAVGELPKSLVIGHRGRCGKGALKLFNALGIEAKGWGSKDTKGKGPIDEILDFHLLVNTVLMTKAVPPFLTEETISKKRKLSAISDISCDPTGPYNPLPIYSEITTMDRPIRRLREDQVLDITAIDHLPSLLPKESSEDFCQQLLPHLIQFLDNQIENTPWQRSLELFYAKLMEYGLDDKSHQGPPSSPELVL